MGNATANIGASGYNMGQGGYAGYAKIQLPGMTASPDTADTSAAVNFRKDILYYFSNLEIEGGPLGIKDFDQGKKEVKDVHKAIADARKQAASGAEEMQTVKSAIEKALRSVRSSAPGWLADAAESAISAIQSILPDIIRGLLSELGKLGVPVLGNIKQFATNFAEGVKKTLLLWNTRGVYETLRKGAPTEIVKVLRKELKSDAAIAFSKAVYEIAKGVATTLTAGVSTAVTGVIDAIGSFLSYIWGVYKKARDYFALKKYFTASRVHFTANDGIIYSQKAFLEWFAHWLDELPIIASHCVCSSVTGSYFGFMTAIAADGSRISDSQLKRGHGAFSKLKKPSKDYVKKYPHSFTSSDGVVKLSLTITQKGGYDTTDGAAAKSVGWFRRGLMKAGIIKNRLY